MGDRRAEPLHRPPRHGRVLRVGRAAPPAGAEGEAGRRLRLGAAGGGDDGELRGAAAGRDPLGDAGGGRAPRLPDAVYLQPDFTAYREASRRGDGDPAPQRRDGRGGRPRRGLHRPDRDLLAEGDDAADRAPRSSEETAARPARSGSPRAGCWPRSPASSASPPGWSCSRGPRRSSASPASPPAWSPGSARRRSRGSSGWGSAPSPSSRARDEVELKAYSARAPAAGSRAAPAFEDETPLTRRTRDQVAVDRDHLRHRRRRPRGARGLDRLARRGALPAAARSATSRGRTIGIKVRLDDWTNVTRSQTVEAPTNDRGRCPRSPSSCCGPTPRPARCACSASGWPQFGDGEPAGGSDRGGRAASLRCSSASPASGWRAPRRGRGSAAAALVASVRSKSRPPT